MGRRSGCVIAAFGLRDRKREKVTEPLPNAPCREASSCRNCSGSAEPQTRRQNHMQSNTKSNARAFFSRIWPVAAPDGSGVVRSSWHCNAALLVMLSALFLPPLASLRADPTPTPTPPVPLIRKASVALKLSTLATGLTAPLEVTSPADGSGRLFIVQQTGQILILENGAVDPTPFLDVSGRMVVLMPDYD